LGALAEKVCSRLHAYEKGSGVSAPLNSSVPLGLKNLYVLGLETLGTLHDVELHCLAFLQAAEAIRLNGRKMHEHVFAILPADEAVSFGVVKPLHCSLFH
jgi:hypothetical protein